MAVVLAEWLADLATKIVSWLVDLWRWAWQPGQYPNAVVLLATMALVALMAVGLEVVRRRVLRRAPRPQARLHRAVFHAGVWALHWSGGRVESEPLCPMDQMPMNWMYVEGGHAWSCPQCSRRYSASSNYRDAVHNLVRGLVSLGQETEKIRTFPQELAALAEHIAKREEAGDNFRQRPWSMGV